MYAVLDLYGRITAVSIVSSSLMEDTESVKAPSLSSDSCSEGEDDSTPVKEVPSPALRQDPPSPSHESSDILVSLTGGGRAVRPRSHRHGLSGEPRQKHPAVQSEPDGSPGVQLQPGPAGHCPATGSPAALPGSFLIPTTTPPSQVPHDSLC